MTGNSAAKVSKDGVVTTTKAGDFTVTAYVNKKKADTVKFKTASFGGFEKTEIKVSPMEGHIEFVEFKGCENLIYDDVEVVSANTKIANVYKSMDLNLDGDSFLCDGIYIEGIKEGTTTDSATIQRVTKDIKVIVGDGKEKLSPVEAVRNNDFSGYDGNTLTTLKWVKNFIGTNNLTSDKSTDREKVTVVQNYLNQTHMKNPNGSQHKGVISGILLDGVWFENNDCGSYSYTFSFLMKCIGIEVYVVNGSADPGDNKWYGHGWNKVKVDGTWYYIDSYWNAIRRNFDYFLSETLWSNRPLRRDFHHYMKM